jgi:hypothetical protein
MSTANRFLNIEFGNSDDYSQGTVDSTAAIFFATTIRGQSMPVAAWFTKVRTAELQRVI